MKGKMKTEIITEHFSVLTLAILSIFGQSLGLYCYECFNIATIGSRDCLEPTTKDGNVIECPEEHNGCMKATMKAILKRDDQVLKDWVMFRYCDYLEPGGNSSTFLKDHQHYRGLDDCAIQTMIKHVLRDRTRFHKQISVMKVSSAAIFRCNQDKCNDQHGFKTTEETVITPADTIEHTSFMEVGL